MIDTDKYEGHTEGEWDLHSMGDGWTIGQLRKIDRTLMQDAPLLLAEVKRLRKENDVLAEAIKEDNEILKKHIETLAELKRLRKLRKQLEDCKRQIQFTADWIRDRGEDTHAKELDEFLEWME